MEQNSQPPQQPPGSGPQEDLLSDVYDDSMEGYDKPVKRVRILLFIMAGLQLLAIFTATDLPEPENWITMGLFVFLAGVFAVLAFWTKKRPYTAIITALSIYIVLHVLSAILEPASIVRGIIVKIIVVVMLVTALKNAKEIQQWMDAKREREGL
jgi:prepilin signal peptidase PulO-like enzyme (type II secretory pathway)